MCASIGVLTCLYTPDERRNDATDLVADGSEQEEREEEEFLPGFKSLEDCSKVSLCSLGSPAGWLYIVSVLLRSYGWIQLPASILY